MKLLYTAAIKIYSALIGAASLFDSRARLWVEGRRGWREELKKGIAGMDRIIWVHCASLGEFEQGRPVMEMIRQRYPEYRLVLTFFSPSGYEVRKKWEGADYICYLPADTPGNAQAFISIVKPLAAVFIKYEFWYNFINELQSRRIPVFLVSGIFRKDQHFFKWYGGFFRKMLEKYDYFFVQDSHSGELLGSLGLNNVAVTGDTRFDRVIKIAESAVPVHAIEQFAGNERIFIAGSCWERDEAVISEYVNNHPFRMKWIFAPHETNDRQIERLLKLLKVSYVRLSQFTTGQASARVLIIDSVGILASAYRYAYIAAIGGGFGKGIHNILEAACWGVPVLFGPNHEKSREAAGLIGLNGAFCFEGYSQFASITDSLLTDAGLYKKASAASANYVKMNAGATEKILDHLFNKVINNRRLL